MKYTYINNKYDFFALLGVPSNKMNYLLYNRVNMGPENMYSTFTIPKKNGGERTINAPNKELKNIQKKLVVLLENHYNELVEKKKFRDSFLHAFIKDRSIITNARIHRNKNFILNIDLENFFETIHFGRVKGFFEKDFNFKVPSEVALIIAQLICYKGSLPQGAPTSPIISNLIGKILDLRLIKLCKKYKLNYTRYADDLTFSTNDYSFVKNFNKILEDIKIEVNKSGFKVNDKKTRVQNYRLRQDVTNLTVNKKINVQKKYFKNTRAMANHLYRNNEFFIDGDLGTLNQLEGRFAFINQIDKYNNKNIIHKYNSSKKKSNKEYIHNLNSREKEYRKFIFYRLFYANPNPIIATEGKTDIRYIKAALKNLYDEYPELIEKNDNQFLFKISFLNRFRKKTDEMNKLQYFLNLAPHGADSLKNIFKYYKESESSYPNYMEYFKKLGNNMPNNPVIILFDNELHNKKKPLSKFCTNLKLTDDDKSILKLNLNICLKDNLYLLTNQLIGTSKENQLEDLFQEETLSKIINNKSFSTSDEYDKSIYYGKEIFSQYISSNYETENFDNFRPLLDNIVKIINDYKMNKCEDNN
ncbi:retron Ec67 family RNA-directed DNA polymerase/endonuclease [Mammaliicoccus sciuri]|uniref:retron Ec67 family RNA-directed DNA polymerase/endonuclease n=1 Tax=Mammaliicoccus sciuri TaxID=1296 RepID=UPI0037C9A383